LLLEHSDVFARDLHVASVRVEEEERRRCANRLRKRRLSKAIRPSRQSSCNIDIGGVGRANLQPGRRRNAHRTQAKGLKEGQDFAYVRDPERHT